MEVTDNINLGMFLNKKVRIITEHSKVYIGKMYYIDAKRNFKLTNCKEFVKRFENYYYNGFYKNVNFNGGKKMTIDFESNSMPLDAPDRPSHPWMSVNHARRRGNTQRASTISSPRGDPNEIKEQPTKMVASFNAPQPSPQRNHPAIEQNKPISNQNVPAPTQNFPAPIQNVAAPILNSPSEPSAQSPPLAVAQAFAVPLNFFGMGAEARHFGNASVVPGEGNNGIVLVPILLQVQLVQLPK